MRSRVVVTAVLAAAVGLGTAVVPVWANQERPDGALRWHSCSTGSEDEVGQQFDALGGDCAEIEVPVDYRVPGGRKITVAFSRLKATDRANRIGALVLNDGGPGVPSFGMPLRKREVLGEAGRRYDLIGVDTRFTGRSAGLDCKWPTSLHLRSADTRADFKAGLRLSQDLADRCAQEHGDLLAYASTANAARDMEQVRQALGEEKLHYLGYSYGSYLGAVYLQLFGQYAGRFVLDGPLDPERFGPALFQETGKANEEALVDWATWAAGQNSTYALGRTPAEVVATVRRLITTSGRRPIQVGSHQIDRTLVPVMVWMLLPDDRPEANAVLARVLVSLRKAAAGDTSSPDPTLVALAEFTRTGVESQIASSLLTVICADRVAEPRAAKYWSDIQRHRATEPVFGPLVRNATPCTDWPGEPVEEPVRVHNSHPALLISATGDTRATWDQAVAMRRALTGSRLLSIDARKHGLYGEYGNTCIDSTATAYLVTGRLMARDTAC